MKNKKGFTLIELIAVIFILALIVVIVVPMINDNINKSKVNVSNEQVRQIEDAAKQWGLDNVVYKDGKLTDGNKVINSVTIRTLQKDGYLDDKGIIDAKTKKEIPSSTKVCITYSSNQYNYEFKGAC